MAIPQNREELLQAIETNYKRLRAEFETVPSQLAWEATLEGHAKGTHMSVHNLASYLLGWNELVLKWLAKSHAAEPIDFPETGFNWNQLGKLAQKFYDDYEGLDYKEVLAKLDSAKSSIVAFLEKADNGTLYGSVWYEKYTMGRMIQFNTSSPYANARTRLRKWKKAKGL